MHRWYTRPVFFVEDVARSLHFYLDTLGYSKIWHEADGEGSVCQIERAECEIILCEDRTRKDRARLFISLTPEGITQLEHEIAERSIPSRKSWWGYDVIQVTDPDGNELLFALPSTQSI